MWSIGAINTSKNLFLPALFNENIKPNKNEKGRKTQRQAKY